LTLLISREFVWVQNTVWTTWKEKSFGSFRNRTYIH